MNNYTQEDGFPQYPPNFPPNFSKQQQAYQIQNQASQSCNPQSNPSGNFNSAQQNIPFVSPSQSFQFGNQTPQTSQFIQGNKFDPNQFQNKSGQFPQQNFNQYIGPQNTYQNFSSPNQSTNPLPKAASIAPQSEEVKYLKIEIKKLQKQYEDEREKRREKKQVIKSLQSQLKNEQKYLMNKEQLTPQLQKEIEQKNEKIEKLKLKNKKLKQELSKDIKSQKEKKKKLKEDLDTKDKQLHQKEIIISSSSKEKPNLILEQCKNENAEYRVKISQLENQIQQLKENSLKAKNDKEVQEIKQLRKQIDELQAEKKQLQLQVEKEGNSLREELKQSALLRNEIKSYKKEIEEKEQGIEGFKKLLRKSKEEILQLKQTQQELQNELQIQQKRTKNQVDLLEEAHQEIVKLRNENSSNQGDLEKLRMMEKQKKEQEKIKQRIENKRILELQQSNKILQQSYLKSVAEKQELQKNIEEKNKVVNELRKNAKQDFGKIEVCFVVDITKSMEPYKKQTQDSIQGSVKAIQQETGRQVSWAIIAYQDIAEFKALSNQYRQYGFTEDSSQFQDYIQKLGCGGGDDTCEDIKGGLKQMVQNLKWTAKFRIAILICDAPCHGNKYHSIECEDNYPDDDIEEAIDLMIKQEIMLVGIQFVQLTSIMIQEITNIYKRKGKEELFMPFNLQNNKIENIYEQLINLVKEACATRTGTKSNVSKIKIKSKQLPKTKDGAMEALCKNKNFKSFDQDPLITKVESKCKVFRVELGKQSFEENLKTVKNISSSEFHTFEESEWDCISTTQPIACGMMKNVFLMKKKNDTQYLYVLKAPIDGVYSTLEAAKQDCRAHLICKNLMIKFMRELRDKYQSKGISHQHIPQIQYSDILILQETTKAFQTKFYIAERFFDGEFIKYNNNWGFILGDETIMNKVAQAFTFYTYYISNLNYMVCDIQGVGAYFTDPALSTQSGDYDEADTGVDGHKMFLVNFENKKQLAMDILSVMDIQID